MNLFYLDERFPFGVQILCTTGHHSHIMGSNRGLDSKVCPQNLEYRILNPKNFASFAKCLIQHVFAHLLGFDMCVRNITWLVSKMSFPKMVHSSQFQEGRF